MTREPFSGVGFRPTAVPSIREVEESCSAIPTLFREAFDRIYDLEGTESGRGRSFDSTDPTAQAALSNIVSREDANGDTWAGGSAAVRQAWEDLHRCESRLRVLIRTDEHRGMAADGKAASQTWTAGQLERVQSEHDRKAVREGRTYGSRYVVGGPTDA